MATFVDVRNLIFLTYKFEKMESRLNNLIDAADNTHYIHFWEK